MSIRRRLPSDESRSAALEAARLLLLEAGPQAVTLKAVAGRIGRTHANLLHHFGSAAGLQKELAAHMARSVCATIAEAVRAHGNEPATRQRTVDLVFDVFDREGGGALASWMLASGNEDALDPIVETIHRLVDDIHPAEQGHDGQRIMHEATYTLVLLALGDALMGERLAASLQVARATARERAVAMIGASLARLPGGGC